MKILHALFLFIAVPSLPVDLSAGDTVLTLHANESFAQIQRRDASSPQTKLPAMELSLQASFACPVDTTAESLTVSISDTFRRYGPEEIANASKLETSLSVPANQFAPVLTPDFCVDGMPQNEKGLLLPGIATAHVSLRCGGENVTPSVHFASVTLPLRLHCLVEDGGQDPSADR
jgi:hypothetical protein